MRFRACTLDSGLVVCTPTPHLHLFALLVRLCICSQSGNEWGGLWAHPPLVQPCTSSPPPDIARCLRVSSAVDRHSACGCAAHVHRTPATVHVRCACAHACAHVSCACMRACMQTHMHRCTRACISRRLGNSTEFTQNIQQLTFRACKDTSRTCRSLHVWMLACVCQSFLRRANRKAKSWETISLEGLAGLDCWAVLQTLVATSAWSNCEHPRNQRTSAKTNENRQTCENKCTILVQQLAFQLLAFR